MRSSRESMAGLFKGGPSLSMGCISLPTTQSVCPVSLESSLNVPRQALSRRPLALARCPPGPAVLTGPRYQVGLEQVGAHAVCGPCARYPQPRVMWSHVESCPIHARYPQPGGKVPRGQLRMDTISAYGRVKTHTATHGCIQHRCSVCTATADCHFKQISMSCTVYLPHHSDLHSFCCTILTFTPFAVPF